MIARSAGGRLHPLCQGETDLAEGAGDAELAIRNTTPRERCALHASAAGGLITDGCAAMSSRTRCASAGTSKRRGCPRFAAQTSQLVRFASRAAGPVANCGAASASGRRCRSARNSALSDVHSGPSSNGLCCRFPQVARVAVARSYAQRTNARRRAAGRVHARADGFATMRKLANGVRPHNGLIATCMPSSPSADSISSRRGKCRAGMPIQPRPCSRNSSNTVAR